MHNVDYYSIDGMRTADDIQERNEPVVDIYLQRDLHTRDVAKYMKISSSYNMLEGGLRNHIPIASDPNTPKGHNDAQRSSGQRTSDQELHKKPKISLELPTSERNSVLMDTTSHVSRRAIKKSIVSAYFSESKLMILLELWNCG